MSYSSEEEFESADEDFEEENNKKKNLKNDANNLKEVNINSKVEKKHSDRVKLEKHSETEDIKSESSDKKDDNKLPPCNKIENPENETNHAKQSKSQSKTECVKPPRREECWEFDDWGDKTVNKSKEKIQKENLDKTSYENINAAPQQCWEFEDWGEKDLKVNEPILDGSNDGDGWDIDDWGGEIEIDEAKSTTNHNNIRVANELKNKHSTQQIFDEKNNDCSKSAPDKQNQSYSNVLDKLSKENENNQSWGWKSWGSLLSSTASTLTTSVSKGLSTVIETSIGVPDPEEMAKIRQDEINKKKQQNPETEVSVDKDDKNSSLGNISWGSLLSTASTITTSGLDTLEGIGKKTMNILQENDPGLMNKRKMLGLNDRPILSQVLREAKQKTEETERNLKQMQKHHYKKQLHFETLFDDYHGLVHLEALEMLSKQSSLKLQTLLTPLTGKALNELQETLNEVEELCELPDQDNEDADGLYSVEELSKKLSATVEDLDISVDFKEILRCWEENTNWLTSVDDPPTGQQIHDKALHCLAQSTALCVNKMHKLAEMILILDHHSTANEADSLVQLTTLFCWHISGIASRFSDKLTENSATEDANSLIVSIFYEGSNSTSHIQKTFQLFIPILQIGAA